MANSKFFLRLAGRVLGALAKPAKPTPRPKTPTAINKPPSTVSLESLIEDAEARENKRRAAGSVDGRHFTTYVDEVKALKRSGDLDEAAGLLLRLIDAVENESRSQRPASLLAPWYYEQLAIIYRKKKDHAKESALLRRYVAGHRSKKNPPMPHMIERLAKAQSLAVVDAAAPIRTPEELKLLRAAARKSERSE